MVSTSPPRSATCPAGDLAAINNSFGFGGHNVAVAFTNAYATRRQEADDPTRLAAAGSPRQHPPKKVKLPRDQDPRNPNFRLAALLDAGSVELITPDDDSGMLAAVGTINGCRVVPSAPTPR